MRYHPALYQNYRQAARDDVLPLSKPIIGRDGTEITKLPIAKGTKIILSIAAYNRCERRVPVSVVFPETENLTETKKYGGTMLMNTNRSAGSTMAKGRKARPLVSMETCEWPKFKFLDTSSH